MLAMRAPPPAATARQAPPSTAAAFAVQRRRRPLRSPCTAVSDRCLRCTPPSAAIAFATIYSAGSSHRLCDEIQCRQQPLPTMFAGQRRRRRPLPSPCNAVGDQFVRRALRLAPAALTVRRRQRPSPLQWRTAPVATAAYHVRKASAAIGGRCLRHATLPAILAVHCHRRPLPLRDGEQHRH